MSNRPGAGADPQSENSMLRPRFAYRQPQLKHLRHSIGFFSAARPLTAIWAGPAYQTRALMKWTSLLFLALGVAIGAIAGCQNYSFEPVVPLAVSQTTQSKTITARQDKPNTMLVFDRSGSRTLPIDSTVPACRLDGGAGTCGQSFDDCPAACVTRDRAIKSAMNTFLTNSGTVARLGMITFPSTSNECAPGTVRVDIPTLSDDATLNAKAAQINAILAASSPAGGTPTSA